MGAKFSNIVCDFNKISTLCVPLFPHFFPPQVFNMAGEQLNMIRYHSSFLGQHIGPVSCLNFHPYNMLLAAGHTDSIVSVYSGEVARSW